MAQKEGLNPLERGVDEAVGSLVFSTVLLVDISKAIGKPLWENGGKYMAQEASSKAVKYGVRQWRGLRRAGNK